MQFSALSVGADVFSIDHHLEWLCVIDPLQTAESVRNWHNIECLQVEPATSAGWILLEDLVHDGEQLLHSLVKSQIFTALNQQVVVFLVAAVDRNSLRSADGGENEDRFAKTSDFYVFAWYRFRDLIVVLSWDLDVHLLVIEVIVVKF